MTPQERRIRFTFKRVYKPPHLHIKREVIQVISNKNTSPDSKFQAEVNELLYIRTQIRVYCRLVHNCYCWL
jgi:hypothetical protein